MSDPAHKVSVMVWFMHKIEYLVNVPCSLQKLFNTVLNLMLWAMAVEFKCGHEVWLRSSFHLPSCLGSTTHNLQGGITDVKKRKKLQNWLTNLKISSSSSTWRFWPVQTSTHACLTVSWSSVCLGKGLTVPIWAWYIEIVSSMMECVNSLKSAVRIQPWEPLLSTLICLETTIVSAEAVSGFSFSLWSAGWAGLREAWGMRAACTGAPWGKVSRVAGASW